MPISVTQENFDKDVLQASKPVVVDVYATWCGPCQQMEPIFQELEKEMTGYVFAKLNVDETRDLAIKYGVISVPTFLFIKNGQVKAKQTGYMSKDMLKEKIESILG
ncbi:MAG TPA: thioredoxin [Candidatus Babeliales bacterium]|nr:thioredoxin [Candidatus Babeliales bacterium]